MSLRNVHQGNRAIPEFRVRDDVCDEVSREGVTSRANYDDL